MLVLEANSIEEALAIWEQVVTAFCSKEVSAEVERARDFIKARSRGDLSQFEDMSQFNYDFEDETDKEEETMYGNRKLLRANSPFYKLFKRSVDKKKKGQEEIVRTNNTFFAPQCIDVLVKQYLALFPLLSASVLDGGLLTNTHIELYWKDQRRIIKDIPDRTMWPPRYLAALQNNIRRESKNFLLHNIIPTLKFGGKQKTGDNINFSDYFDDEMEKKKNKNVFKPTKSKSQQKKRKINETFYGSEEQWESQKKRKPSNSSYIKGKLIDFDEIDEKMEPETVIESIRVTGTKKALGEGEDENTKNLAPMAIILKAEDINYITNEHCYLTTDAVDAGLCLLDRKLTEESAVDVTVYSTQNCRLILNGVQNLIQPGKFVTILPRNFGINEEGSRMAAFKGGDKSSEPGGHFTLVSNLFCDPNEVNIYETYRPYRNAANLLPPNSIKLVKSLCNSEEKLLNVNCVNVAEQSESECGALAVGLAVHLCFYAPSEEAIYNRIENVRKTFLNCMKHNSLTYFKMAPRNLEDNKKVLFTIKI